MGLVHRRKFLALVSLPVLVVTACGEIDDPRAEAERARAAAAAVETQPDTAVSAPDSFPPAAENGDPMLPSTAAAGIPPYPGAIVHIRHRRPAPSHRLEAFTFDTWDRVAAFYADSLIGWTVLRTEDIVVFTKEPDQAAVTIQPWDFQELPDDAPAVLRRSRTAIGAAWR